MKEYTVKVYSNRTEWYFNGQFHRDDGPAVEWSNGSKLGGSKFWYRNGQRHRDDGPALEWVDGSKSWYLEGKKLTEEEFKARTNPDNCDGKTVLVDGKEYVLTLKKEV